jgi:putative transposase
VAGGKRTAADLGAWLIFEDESGQGLKMFRKLSERHRRRKDLCEQAEGSSRKSPCSRKIFKAAEGPHVGPARHHPGGEGDRRQQHARVAGRADAVKPGHPPRLIYRVHKPRRRCGDQRKGFTETDYASLFDAAHQQLTSPLVVVCDNSNTHTSAAMTELTATRDWLTIYQLPPYAHELNPVELVWAHLKRSLANLAKRNLAQLTALVKTRLRRMQYRPSLLGGFLASTGLDLAPFGNTHH